MFFWLWSSASYVALKSRKQGKEGDRCWILSTVYLSVVICLGVKCVEPKMFRTTRKYISLHHKSIHAALRIHHLFHALFHALPWIKRTSLTHPLPNHTPSLSTRHVPLYTSFPMRQIHHPLSGHEKSCFSRTAKTCVCGKDVCY